MEMRDISHAQQRLKGTIHDLPLTSSKCFSGMSGANIYLKNEHLQKTGSFKVRGAYNKIAKLVQAGEITSVIASSAGNHAQGVAFAANRLGVKATIVMPKFTPIAKVLATQGYGAKVILHGDFYDDAYDEAMRLKEETGAAFIHPFDDEDVIAGQATIGLEILNELSDVDTVLVPAGGGGLLAGVAFAIKHLNPDVKIIGVQAERADAIVQSFSTKSYTSLDDIYTIADGIAVKKPGKLTTKLINTYVDDMVTVSDGEIASAIIHLMERNKQIVEPAGAVALAAAIKGRVDIQGKNTVCLISGGNIDVGLISKIIEKGLVSRGRLVKYMVLLKDVPGTLERFSHIVAESNANIVSVHYDRSFAELDLNEVILHVVCEVSGFEHASALRTHLTSQGFDILQSVDK